MCDFCLFYWGDLVLLQSVQRFVNNYLLNSCCRLTFISLHNLPYDYCLMCVCVWVLLLSSFYLFSCSRFTIFNQLQVFFLAFRSMCFYFLIVTFHLSSRQLFTERTGRCTFLSHHFLAIPTKKESPRVKLEKKVTKKIQLHGISIIK